MSKQPEKPKPANRMAPPATVRVTVTGQPIGEAGTIYYQGDTLELPADRVAALGALVKPS